MPTGYTARLVEKGQTFEEFAMGCARAFGACIELRDESVDTPIPEEFKPSEHYTDSLREAKEEVARLQGMGGLAHDRFGHVERQKDIASCEKSLADTKEENKRVNDMIQKVKDWRPPTPDHEGMKEFMLQQLDISLSDEGYAQRSLERAIKRSPQDYYTAALKSAIESVKYYEEQGEKDQKRASGNTEWVRQLRQSLKHPETVRGEE